MNKIETMRSDIYGPRHNVRNVCLDAKDSFGGSVSTIDYTCQIYQRLLQIS